MRKTALVTGATGFIGSALCNKLYDDYFVIGVGVGVGVKEENQTKCHKFFQSTLEDIPWALLPNIDVCFHQAANNDTTDMNKQQMFFTNFLTPQKIFSYLYEEKNCKQFVYASSCSVYGNSLTPYKENVTPLKPLNPYAESKKMFEEYADSFAVKTGSNVIGLRYTNVYGPGENHKGKRASMIHQLLHKMLKKERPKIFKNGEQQRDWVYIKDVVKANLCAAQQNTSGVFNVGVGESISFNEIITILNLNLGSNFTPEYIDCNFWDKYQSHTLVDLSHANKIGYFPEYSIRDGIKEFIKEIKKAG